MQVFNVPCPCDEELGLIALLMFLNHFVQHGLHLELAVGLARDQLERQAHDGDDHDDDTARGVGTVPELQERTRNVRDEQLLARDRRKPVRRRHVERLEPFVHY